MRMQCPHNEGVECTDQKCDSCGWNSEVSERRMAERAPEGGVCPHNKRVLCEKKKCSCCGWDPQIAKRRLRRIRYGISGNDERAGSK